MTTERRGGGGGGRGCGDVWQSEVEMGKESEGDVGVRSGGWLSARVRSREKFGRDGRWRARWADGKTGGKERERERRERGGEEGR